MKLTYQSPAYRHIALDGGTGASGCEVTNNHTRDSCPWVISVNNPKLPTSININVFNTAGSVCNVSPETAIAQYGMATVSNIFGS